MGGDGRNKSSRGLLVTFIYRDFPPISSEESKPDSDLDEPWIMTVKGLHNLHNNNNNNNLYKSGGGNGQPKSPSSPNAATVTSSIDNNFTRRETTPTKQTIEAIETNQGLVQLREKANAAAAAYERHDREREQMRNSQVDAEAAREKRASKEVS